MPRSSPSDRENPLQQRADTDDAGAARSVQHSRPPVETPQGAVRQPGFQGTGRVFEPGSGAIRNKSSPPGGFLAVVVLDGEHLAGQVHPHDLLHPEITCRSVMYLILFHVTVGGDDPKHLDEAEALQTDTPPMRGDLDVLDGHIYVFHGHVARVIRIDLEVVLEARQEVPAVPAHHLEVGEAGVPAVEARVYAFGITSYRRRARRSRRSGRPRCRCRPAGRRSGTGCKTVSIRSHSVCDPSRLILTIPTRR